MDKTGDLGSNISTVTVRGVPNVLVGQSFFLPFNKHMQCLSHTYTCTY